MSILIPKSPAIPTGGSGGYRGDYTNVSYTASNGQTGLYHIFASHMTGTEPKGALFYFHGDGAAEFDTYSPSDDYIGTIRQAAITHDLIMVAVRTPDTDTDTWWEEWRKESISTFARDLMRYIYSIHNINLRDIWLYGWSGGSEFITCMLLPYFGSDLIKGGGAIITGGGGAPDPSFSRNYPVADFSMIWKVGENDIPANNYDSYDGVQRSLDGYNYYNGKVTNVSREVIYGYEHDLAPNWGTYVDWTFFVGGFRNSVNNSLVEIGEIYVGGQKMGQAWVNGQQVYSSAPEPDKLYLYSTPGTRYIQAPDYDCEIDVFTFGAGGGGRVGYGDNGSPGDGGTRGDYTSQTLTGIKGGEIKVVVGRGGAGGNGATITGENGGESRVAIGLLSVSAAGGIGGGRAGDSGQQSGTKWGSVGTFFDHSHSVVETKGLSDGGNGGNGGFFGSYSNGQDGGDGYVWMRIREV